MAAEITHVPGERTGRLGRLGLMTVGPGLPLGCPYQRAAFLKTSAYRNHHEPKTFSCEPFEVHRQTVGACLRDRVRRGEALRKSRAMCIIEIIIHI